VIEEGQLVVTDRSSAGKILCSPTRCAPFAYLVSIGGVRERPPAGFGNVAARLRLVFEDDTTHEGGGPTAEDIDRLIRFARGVDVSRGALLVHCQAGISRSTAAALIVLSVVLGPGKAADAARCVKRAVPGARPNTRMLALADRALGARLAEAWERS
jgi:predicted protein tyrosine phosphatase